MALVALVSQCKHSRIRHVAACKVGVRQSTALVALVGQLKHSWIHQVVAVTKVGVRQPTGTIYSIVLRNFAELKVELERFGVGCGVVQRMKAILAGLARIVRNSKIFQ